ncbi:hypothetical protein ['Camptotheca acuminata' phytoplasma]|uniref:hypothetical protein n=1 Tax='Camptotheca acuminata' phytoplasma TaxID=3239192 RepID=UPI003519FECA
MNKKLFKLVCFSIYLFISFINFIFVLIKIKQDPSQIEKDIVIIFTSYIFGLFPMFIVLIGIQSYICFKITKGKWLIYKNPNKEKKHRKY